MNPENEVLHVARVRSGMTQVELAKRLKKPQSFVSAYESGKRAVKVDEFIRIAREVGADPKKLFSTVVKKS